jgi:hypothetical protein
MPTDGIEGAGFVCAIKIIKWRNNSLNEVAIQFGVTFVLKSRENGHTIDWEIEDGEEMP